MVYPLLPAFVTGVLGGGPLALGVLDGAADLAAAGVKLGAGRLSDRPERRGPLVIAGYAAAVAVRPLIAITGAAWQVIGLRVTDRIGKGLRSPPRDAIIADVTPPALRGRAFGLQRGLDHVGAVLGPIAAWGLLTFGAVSVRGVIAISLVPGVLVLGLAVWAARDWRARGAAPPADDAAGTAAPPSLATSPRLPLSIVAISAFHLLRMPETLVILRAQQLGVSLGVIPLLWAGLHAVRASTSFVGGALADRVGAHRAMWLGWASYAALAAGFAVAESTAHAWLLFLALGVVAGLTESPERALVAQAAGARRGTGFGAYHAATGVSALGGGLGLGLVYQQAGGAAAFGVSAVAAAVLAAAAAASGRRAS
jgi:MFS family permease